MLTASVFIERFQHILLGNARCRTKRVLWFWSLELAPLHMQVLESAAFLLVTDRTLWVQSEPQQQDAQPSGSQPAANGAAASASGGNSDGVTAAGPAANGCGSCTAPPQLLWLNAAELRQHLGLQLQGGAFQSGAPNCTSLPNLQTTGPRCAGCLLSVLLQRLLAACEASKTHGNSQQRFHWLASWQPPAQN
jgi:hypothetical protein